MIVEPAIAKTGVNDIITRVSSQLFQKPMPKPLKERIILGFSLSVRSKFNIVRNFQILQTFTLLYCWKNLIGLINPNNVTSFRQDLSFDMAFVFLRFQKNGKTKQNKTKQNKKNMNGFWGGHSQPKASPSKKKKKKERERIERKEKEKKRNPKIGLFACQNEKKKKKKKASRDSTPWPPPGLHPRPQAVITLRLPCSSDSVSHLFGDTLFLKILDPPREKTSKTKLLPTTNCAKLCIQRATYLWLTVPSSVYKELLTYD